MRETLIDFLSLHKDTLYAFGRKAFAVLLIALAGKLLVRISERFVKSLGAGALNIDATLLSLLSSAVKYATIAVCVIMVLGVFGVNTHALIALVGTAGVAIGLALKDTLANVAAGVMFLLLKTFRNGDFIESGDFSGTIKNFDLWITTLETPDGIFIYAPNSSLWALPLKNYSRNTRRRMDLSVGIGYGDSIDQAFQVMMGIAAEETRFLSEPAPKVLVQSLGDSAITIVLRAWTPVAVYWDVYFAQMRLLKEKIESAGLSIPFPQQDVHVFSETSQTKPPPNEIRS